MQVPMQGQYFSHPVHYMQPYIQAQTHQMHPQDPLASFPATNPYLHPTASSLHLALTPNGPDLFKEPPAASGLSQEEEAQLLQQFYHEVRMEDRASEVMRIVNSFKLNPYAKLNIPFDSSLKDVKKQFRKLTLTVHPDKIQHPRGKEAFELLQKAQIEILDDKCRAKLHEILQLAQDNVRLELKKREKKDPLRNTLGRSIQKSQWKRTDEFYKLWLPKAQEFLGRAEFRMQNLNVRITEAEELMRQKAKEKHLKEWSDRAHESNYLRSRNARVSAWRTFMNPSTRKDDIHKEMKLMGGIKPPKWLREDKDRSYIPRVIKREDEWMEPAPTLPPGDKGANIANVPVKFAQQRMRGDFDAEGR
eukprot:gnl/MRDRNA2_/MRDRNA2_165854_c0_seq1.p1 gnl/MRDRNA2_/MRDRNA2_165854_c0~~gnl/MRDRNA2_/MRDRNA2_165854_c0_seq1.p1  ORF type:complete len:361 (+),score=52.12 gnl/MRDRNA2_/MRDRNA2_165854_c0_seq1:1-1083(+)